MTIRSWSVCAAMLAGLVLTVPAVAQDSAPQAPLHLNQFIRKGTAIRTGSTVKAMEAKPTVKMSSAKSARPNRTAKATSDKAASKSPLGEFGPTTPVETSGFAPAERPPEPPASVNGVKVVSPDELNEIDLAADPPTAPIILASNDLTRDPQSASIPAPTLASAEEVQPQNPTPASSTWMIALGFLGFGALAAAGSARFFLARA